MKFYLGTHMDGWLATLDVPLFVSRRRLCRRRTLPRARVGWALDSGGFTELSMHGRWTLPAAAYAAEVRRYHDEVGRMDWAAPQDWMCEPFMLDKTGLTVADHQQRTIDNLLELRSLAPDLPIVPVLQGWTLDDYLRHAEAYAAAGIDLAGEATVGIGSVCRRQHTGQIDRIVSTLAGQGIDLHGFGVKTLGLREYAHALASADSLAWSYNARLNPPLPGCTHRSCANCPRWAVRWRERVLATLDHQQGRLFEVVA